MSIQNQHGNDSRRWNKTGTIVEVKDFDQYMVKVDGSGRLTLRNRRFLRPISPYQDELKNLMEETEKNEGDRALRRSDRLKRKSAGGEVQSVGADMEGVQRACAYFRPWERLSSEVAWPRTVHFYPAPTSY